VNVEKSQRTFAAVTLITVAAVALVLVVYAAVIGTITGGDVVIASGSSVQGTIYYSPNNSTGWATTLDVSNPANSWYARLNVTAGGYSGPVNIDWLLQRKSGPSSWTNIGWVNDTAVTLDGTAQIIYTSGLSSSTNHDWVTEVAGVAGTYHVIAYVNNV